MMCLKKKSAVNEVILSISNQYSRVWRVEIENIIGNFDKGKGRPKLSSQYGNMALAERQYG